MTSNNIFVELFSPFTVTYVFCGTCCLFDRATYSLAGFHLACRYSGVQDSELRCLREYIAREEVLRDIPKWVQALEDGTLPRGSAAILTRVLTGTASQGKRGW